MRKSGKPTWHRSMYRAAAVLGLGLMLGLLPRAARAADVCAGDCDNSTTVTISEVVKLIDITLGTAAATTCPSGVPTSGADIAALIQAVNHAAAPGGSCTVTAAVCGDGVKQTGEDCDVGGICIGNKKAGTSCTKDDDCTTAGGSTSDNAGVCLGGTKPLTVCNSSADCPESTCVRCKTFGGSAIPGDSTHTCAANCSFESAVPITLIPGVVEGTDIKPGTSGAVVHGEVLTIPLPLVGSQTISVGKEKNGKIPAIIKASTVVFPAITVSTIACACVRGLADKTCGGTIFEMDGSLSTDCAPVFTAGDSVCTGKKPCAFVNGDGNAASGDISCATGANGTDYNFLQDSGGSSGVVKPPVITFSGTNAPAGSGLLANTTAIGTVVGGCTGTTSDYGNDGAFCTDDDPQSARGTPQTLPFTTGNSTAQVDNANQTDGDTIGPFSVAGLPFSCSDLAAGKASGGALAGAFVSINQATVGDIVVTNFQKAQ